jgi:amino acid transporter
MALATAAPITAMTGNVPIVIGFGVGSHAPADFLVAAIVLTIFSVGYAAMSKHITATGSFYGYISHGLGQFFGIFSGLIATVCYVVFEASLIGIFSSFARSTIQSFWSITIPWPAIALFGIIVIAVMGYYDIEISGRVLGIFLVTEVAILLILGFAVLFKGGGAHGLQAGSLNPAKAFSAVKGGTAGIGLFFAFWSWIGFETTAVYGEESRNPKKIVGQAVLIAVVAVGVLYTFISWMTIAGNGPSQAVHLSQTNPFQTFFGITQTFVGTWAEDIYKVLIITGSFACALAFHNTASRYVYALGREAPSDKIRNFLGATHSEHKSPHVASIVQSVITLLITLGFVWFQSPNKSAPDVAYNFEYGLMAILGTFMVLICMTICSFAVFWYFHVKKMHPETASWWRTGLFPLIGTVSMGYVVWLLYDNLGFAAGGASSSPVFHATRWIVLAIVVIGIVFALYLKYQRPEQYALMGRTQLEEARERD